jgi:hypothetical protein
MFFIHEDILLIYFKYKNPSNNSFNKIYIFKNLTFKITTKTNFFKLQLQENKKKEICLFILYVLII